MKKYIFIVIALLSAYNINAQEIPRQNQYLSDNPYEISPAWAGIGDCFKIRLNGVAQWIGLKDAPRTQVLSVDGTVGKQMGVGMILTNDKNGNTSQTHFAATYAYHLVIDYYSDQFLSFGMSAKLAHSKVDISNFIDAHEDPGVENNRSFTQANFDIAGLYRYKRFYINLTATNLLNKETKAFADSEPENIRSTYLYTGYKFEAGEDLFFEPSLLYHYYFGDGRAEMDINMKFLKNNRDENYFWLGATYRMAAEQSPKPISFAPMAGMRYEKFYLAYGYQLSLTKIQRTNTGSHFISLGYSFLCNKNSDLCTFWY
ncbi:PorP/SprF family type IX secretion system membrane protein [Aureivirga marina]|uniref:PorP/SprF family type IX secretion system membrane protein n=1 Tax=Aureivirga marina TaxID=1182451 RepID=UPI0018CA52AE|nr:type IX secretion system membrane protein PorP/SprF [Aureivirga marina]